MQRDSRRLLTAACAVMVGVAGLGCAHYRTVQVPPQFVLTRYPTVGLLQFSSATSQGHLPAYASSRFVQLLTEAQPGVRILELGPLGQALAAVGRPQLDAEAIRALCARNGIQALFVGSLELTQPQAQVSLSSFTSLGVSADVTATLAATLYDGQSGATLWTRTASDRDSAGAVGVSEGDVEVGVQGSDRAYLRMVRRSTDYLTEPFRPHWVNERVD